VPAFRNKHQISLTLSRSLPAIFGHETVASSRSPPKSCLQSVSTYIHFDENRHAGTPVNRKKRGFRGLSGQKTDLLSLALLSCPTINPVREEAYGVGDLDGCIFVSILSLHHTPLMPASHPGFQNRRYN
jgi:hypothetical protein